MKSVKIVALFISILLFSTACTKPEVNSDNASIEKGTTEESGVHGNIEDVSMASNESEKDSVFVNTEDIKTSDIEDTEITEDELYALDKYLNYNYDAKFEIQEKMYYIDNIYIYTVLDNNLNKAFKIYYDKDTGNMSDNYSSLEYAKERVAWEQEILRDWFIEDKEFLYYNNMAELLSNEQMTADAYINRLSETYISWIVLVKDTNKEEINKFAEAVKLDGSYKLYVVSELNFDTVKSAKETYTMGSLGNILGESQLVLEKSILNGEVQKEEINFEN